MTRPQTLQALIEHWRAGAHELEDSHYEWEQGCKRAALACADDLAAVIAQQEKIGESLGLSENLRVAPAAVLPQEPRDDLGLSIDMLDVDRLREWARLILLSVPFVAGKLQILATNMETAIRDIGQLRAAAETREGWQPLIQAVDELIAVIEKTDEHTAWIPPIAKLMHLRRLAILPDPPGSPDDQ